MNGPARKTSRDGVLRNMPMFRRIASSALATLLVACAHDGVAPGGGHAAVADGTDHRGRMRGYVESSRASDFCPDPHRRRDDERCLVTRGWDYSRGIAVVRTFDPAGRLMTEEHPPGADLSLVPAEQARVEALVRADPRTAPIVNRPGVMLWSGGFVMREPGDPFCDRGSRCIRAIAADDGGSNALLHSVVDLMTDRVVYPDYKPSGRHAIDTSKENAK